METHLGFDALLRAAYGAPELRDEQHLVACTACSATLAELRAVPRERPLELPEAFWHRQQATIVAAVRSRLRARPLRTWATVLATSALLALGVIASGVRPTAPPPADGRLSPRLTQPQFSAADEALWRDAQITANRIEARALAPARLLVPKTITEAQ